MPKVGIIITARINSKRLRKKVLRKISGKTILERVVISMFPFFGKYRIVLAGPLGIEGKFDFLKKYPIDIMYVNTENFVIDRMVSVIKEYSFTHAVRICADRIVNNYEYQQKLIDFSIKEDADFVGYNTDPLRSSTGEVYKAQALIDLVSSPRNILLDNENPSNNFKNPKVPHTNIFYPPFFCCIDTKTQLKQNKKIIKKINQDYFMASKYYENWDFRV